MGDMLTLIEKASQEYDEKRSLELAEKMRENTFDFNDFIDQLDQVQNMGPMEDLLKMLPGMANNPAMKNLKVDEREIARKRAIVSSMTPAERENPDLLNLAVVVGLLLVQEIALSKSTNSSRTLTKPSR